MQMLNAKSKSFSRIIVIRLLFITLTKSSLFRMMKLVQKRRQVEAAKPIASGKKKHAKTSGSGGVQSGLSAFFKISSNSNPGVAKRKTPPTSPENGDDSDVEIIEVIDAKKSKSCE